MARRSSNETLVRSNQLINRKFTQYLIPTMITYAAMSLNEFVDSMLVSNLLSSDAMAIVGLGAPLMLVMAAVYSLLGSGGSTVYAIAVGRRDHDTAGKSLTASVALSLITGVLFLVLGLAFSSPLSRLLCHDAELLGEFEQYMHVLLYSAPLVIVILTIVSFLPSAGYPGLSTAVNVIANVINIVMDYVYIRIVGMGVEGAAWATLTGYCAAAVVMIIIFLFGHHSMYFSRQIRESFSLNPEIVKLGGPDAMAQIGLSIQFAACNHMAATTAGTNGVVALSLCLQSSSLMSVFIGAVIGSAVPIMAVLHGQRDYSGESGILRSSMISQFFLSVAGMIVFIIFAPQAAALYNIKQTEQLALAVTAFRIYALMYIPRDAVIVFFRYLKVIGLDRYSTVLSALDSFAGIVPIAWILSSIWGAKGLFWAFPVTSFLLLVLMIVCNLRYAKNSDRLEGVLLIENDEDARPIIDVTITNDPADISGLSERVQEQCEANGVSTRDAMRAALVTEEIAVYVANIKRHSTYADVLVRQADNNIEIDFRSLGEPINPLSDSDSDITENVTLLRNIASSIETDYLLGMNSTRIIMECTGTMEKA